LLAAGSDHKKREECPLSIRHQAANQGCSPKCSLERRPR
jgi:hypothetical protein